MQARGYMIEVEWDGDVLTARGTTKASQIALRGQERNEGPLALSADRIERVDFKRASALVNGRLDVFTTDGHRYQLHFRRKQLQDFEELAAALSALK